MNFQKIVTLDTSNAEQELLSTKMWNWLALRKMVYGSQHTSVDDIVLRFQSLEGNKSVSDFYNNLECVDFCVQALLPHTMQLVREFAKDRILGRLMVAKLKKGGTVGTHVDEGDYNAKFDRFHIVITTNYQVLFTCGGESTRMGKGEVWWLDNKQPHSVLNSGQTDRIHIIVDLLK